MTVVVLLLVLPTRTVPAGRSFTWKDVSFDTPVEFVLL